MGRKNKNIKKNEGSDGAAPSGAGSAPSGAGEAPSGSGAVPSAAGTGPQQPGPSNSGNVAAGKDKQSKSDGSAPAQKEQRSSQQQQQQPQQQVERGPQQQQQTKRGPQQQQAQRGPQEQQQGQQRDQQKQQQQSQRKPQQQHPQQQGQAGQQQQQGQWGPSKQQEQAQRGPQQQRQQPQQQAQWGPSKQQEQDRRGPQPQQQGQWGPPKQQQQSQGKPQQQQQQVQHGPQHQQQPQQQGQRGPAEQQPQQQQEQWGPPKQQQQAQGEPQQQQQIQRVPQQKQQQGYREPQQQQISQQRIPTSSSSSSISSTPSSKSGMARGTAGKPGSVEVNYLDINLDKMPSVAYHYDVVITPDRPKKFMRPAFDQFNRQHFKDIAMAFDGRSSFYTVVKFPASTFEKEVQLDDSGSRKIIFKIAVKETQDSEIDLNSLRSYFKERIFDKPMRALQCLEVVLASPCHEKGVRVGRSFFFKPEHRYDLNDGYEMWIGLYQAAILGDRPFLNVDISHKSFPSACMITDYMRNNFRDCNLNQPLEYRSISNLKDYLKNVNIVYEPPKCFGSFPRTYKVNDVSKEPANRLTFRLEDGTQKTIAEYFSSKGYKLAYPNLNCLHVGSTVKKIYVPIELCSIPPGQAIMKKDAPRQVQQMIRYAATSTNERKDKIMRMLTYFKHNVDLKLLKFGVQVGNRFTVVPMRILRSPYLEYFKGEKILPSKGSWRMNDNTQFLDCKQPNNRHQWAVIYSKRGRLNHNSLQNFVTMVSRTAGKLNVSLAANPDIIPFENIGSILRELRKKSFDLVFVVIPKFGISYAQIKQEAELKVGQLTQCILEDTIERRCNLQTVANILLKVNHKLNGTNHKLSPSTNIALKNVMFLGADVTHPSPDQKHIPSVVGVAASHDAAGACYNMQYRLQKSSCENIEDMDSIFAHHMQIYFKYQGKYPDYIIYYRDGVSDGQFPIVKNNELRAIRAVCTRLRCSPKLTCIITIKRHHTRFFPQTVNPRDKFNNVEPGTVVDQVIVHPNEVQFFMVSHQSIQGTAKPTRYNVIEDDAKMNIDDLQTLTYNLCHMFPRCNRVVSYPAPAYLAHLVAFRGRVYIDGEQRFSEPKQEYAKRLVNLDFMARNPMYFI